MDRKITELKLEEKIQKDPDAAEKVIQKILEMEIRARLSVKYITALEEEEEKEDLSRRSIRQ